MLRQLIVDDYDAAPAYYTAGDNLATGMGVTKDYANNTADLPEAETADNIWLVQKDRVAYGTLAGIENVSDYDPAFNTFKAGEKVVLYRFKVGSIFATDAYKTTDLVVGNVGKRVAVGTDGKWCLATATAGSTAGTASRYVFRGLYNDAGHTLAKIEVVEDATANA